MLLILVTLILQTSHGLGLDSIGTIWPTGELPISNSYTNLNCISDYTFTFYTDHSLSQGCLLSIAFPSQFKSGLGITSCTSSLGACSVSAHTVTVTLSSPVYSAQVYSLRIFQVQNPSAEGGTGSFVLQSWEAGNLVDSNSIFGVAGIAQAIGTLLSAGVNIVENDSALAGALARYEFKFELYRPLAAYHWLRFTFPADGFGLSENPTCTSFKIQGYQIQGNLVCSTSGNSVSLLGISQEIPAFIHVGVRIAARNPGYAVASGIFAVETGKNQNSYGV